MCGGEGGASCLFRADAAFPYWVSLVSKDLQHDRTPKASGMDRMIKLLNFYGCQISS